MTAPRFLADENLHGAIVRALKRRHEPIDLVRLQDTARRGAADPEVLQFAAEEQRIVLTHDAGLRDATTAGPPAVARPDRDPGRCSVQPYRG